LHIELMISEEGLVS